MFWLYKSVYFGNFQGNGPVYLKPRVAPMNMLLFSCIVVIISNSKRMQAPQNLFPPICPSWIQVYFLTTSKGMDQTI